LEAGLAITGEDLDACAKKQGVEIKSGDFVCIRTGFGEDMVRSGDWSGYIASVPGLAFDTCEWIHKKEVAMVCADQFCVEVVPGEFSDGTSMPMHWIVLPHIGCYFGEMFDFRELGDDWYVFDLLRFLCLRGLTDLPINSAADGIYEFLYSGAPIPISKAVGSPVCAIAMK
jgi:kynurenine formamidase